jgi:two-component system, NarL family, sensor histidine kinase DesK
MPMPFRLLPEDPEQGWLRYAWLVYALPIPIVAAIGNFSPRDRALLWAACPLFLALYFGGYWVRGRRIYWIVAAFATMAIGLSTITSLTAVCFVFGAACIATDRPRIEAVIALTLQAALAVAAGLLLDMNHYYYISAVGVAPFIGALCIHGRESAQANNRLRLAHSEIERLAQLAERERIARDLHDLLGHTLSVITLKSELARKLLTVDQQGAAHEIADIEQIARNGLAQVRTAITGYRSTGLAAEIESARDTLRTASIATVIEVQSLSLGAAEETALALALREATTNVIRHAGAQSCRIRLYAHDGDGRLEVEDDGSGTERPFGNGLTGMRERLVALGGAMSRELVRTQAPQGTRLVISLPLRATS